MLDLEMAPDTTLICYCQKVDKGTIVNAVKAGKNTLPLIKESTKACTGGNCKELNPSGKCCSKDILELIRLYSK